MEIIPRNQRHEEQCVLIRSWVNGEFKCAKTHLAYQLGVSPQTINNRLKELGLKRPPTNHYPGNISNLKQYLSQSKQPKSQSKQTLSRSKQPKSQTKQNISHGDNYKNLLNK